MPGEERSRKRVESFINELEQGTASPTDEEFTKLKRMIVERRGRAAALNSLFARLGTDCEIKIRVFLFCFRGNNHRLRPFTVEV